jgi:hypothetical protein
VTVFPRLFPRAIGGTLREFLFGSPCQRCEGGSYAKRWARYDGTGSWRMHHTWIGPGHDYLFDYGDEYCARNGWFSRHRLLTALIAAVLALIVAMVAMVNAAHAAEPPKLPVGVTCEAVRERVAEHGRAAAIAWALASGYSWRQIRDARKICGI